MGTLFPWDRGRPVSGLHLKRIRSHGGASGLEIHDLSPPSSAIAAFPATPSSAGPPDSWSSLPRQPQPGGCRESPRLPRPETAVAWSPA